MYRIIAWLVFAVGSVVLNSGVNAEGARLKGNDLTTVVAGKTYSGTTRNGGTWEATYSDDGRLDVRVLNSSWSDSGTWEIKDDRVCSERSKRAYMCYEVMRISDKEYDFVDERGETSKSTLKD